MRCPTLRRNHASPLARLKTLNYLESLMAREEAKKRGVEEALMLNIEGEVAEASTANIFWARGNRLYTPSEECGVLPGIVRGWVLEKVGGCDLSVEEGKYTFSHLEEAEEVFLTNSLMGIMPVCQLEGKVISSECPGPLTRILMKIYQEEISLLGQ